MRKLLATIKALIKHEVSIDIIDKTPVSNTPGDVTITGHN
jgi:hypothetical protein